VKVTGALVPPVVATLRVPAPAAALEAMVRVAVIRLALTTITLLTVIPVLALTVLTPPDTKLLPVRFTATEVP
jgi:prepilin signal peptidase PulO-like enzyme (type II secretory pathway)